MPLFTIEVLTEYVEIARRNGAIDSIQSTVSSQRTMAQFCLTSTFEHTQYNYTTIRLLMSTLPSSSMRISPASRTSLAPANGESIVVKFVLF